MGSWSSFAEFARMGGYGLYVWGSFGMCALVLLIEQAGIAQRRRNLRGLPPDDLGNPHEGAA
ncbi:MAG: heme exporter protein CcmD [Rubrivivax sp.]